MRTSATLLFVSTAGEARREHLEYAPPPGVAPDAGEATVVHLNWRGSDDDSLRVAQRLRSHAREYGQRMPVVLSGPIERQHAFCVEVLARPRLRRFTRLLTCIAGVSPPLHVPLRQHLAYADELVVPSEGAREAVSAHLAAQRPRVAPGIHVIPHSFPVAALTAAEPAASARAALGIPAGHLLIAAPARRASRWSGMTAQLFRCWSGGEYVDCLGCRARTVHRLRAESARFEAPRACLHCGSTDLAKGVRRPRATLLQYLMEPDAGTPDPGVLVDWLGMTNVVVVEREWSPSTPARPLWSRVLGMADVSLIPADNLIPDGLAAASLACGIPCLTTAFAVEQRPGLVGLRARSWSWSYRNHLTAYPDVAAATRVLDDLMDTPASLRSLREAAATGRDGLNHSHTLAAWRDLLARQLDAVRAGRRPRGRLPRSTGA